MNIYNKGGLFGLLQIEQLRDTIRKTEEGQKIIELQEQKESAIELVVGTIRFMISVIICLITVILLKNIWFTDLTKTTVGAVIVLASFLFPFMFLYEKIYNHYIHTEGIKKIDAEINKLAQTDEHLNSVVSQLKTLCPNY